MISLLSMQTFLGVDRIPDLHVLKSGFRNQKQFLFVEFGIKEYFGCGIWNPELWNPECRISSRNLESRAQVPPTKTGIRYLESGIHGVESRIQYCLGFPYTVGRIVFGRKCLTTIKTLDHCTFLENCPPTPPLGQY